MNQTKDSNRIVVIAGVTLADEKNCNRKPTNRRATSHRIVVIRNGELVNRPGR